MKQIIIILFLLVLLPLVTAQTEPAFIFEKNTTVDLKISCFQNDSNYCDSGTTCNLTIQYPNASVLINNDGLTNQINYHNITLTPQQTEIIGEYTSIIQCSGNTTGVSTFTYLITQTGTELTVGISIIYLFILIGILITLGLTIWGAVVTPWNNPRNEEGVIIGFEERKYLKLFLVIISYLLIMFFFGIMRSVTNNFLAFDNASGFFNLGFTILFALVWPLIIGSLFIFIITWISNKKLMKKLNRGLVLR